MSEKNGIKHYSVKPLQVRLAPSRLLALLLGGACAGTLTLVALLPLPLWLKPILALAVLGTTLPAMLRDALLRWPRSAVVLEVDIKSQLRYMTRDGVWHDAAVLGSSFVTPWLTVLNLRQPSRRFAKHVVILPDAVDADGFRQLRVWLNWGSQDAAAEGTVHG